MTLKGNGKESLKNTDAKISLFLFVIKQVHCDNFIINIAPLYLAWVRGVQRDLDFSQLTESVSRFINTLIAANNFPHYFSHWVIPNI